MKQADKAIWFAWFFALLVFTDGVMYSLGLFAGRSGALLFSIVQAVFLILMIIFRPRYKDRENRWNRKN